MWTKSHSVVSKTTSKEQIWKLFSNVDNWASWDQGIEYAKLEGPFQKGSFFTLKPKGGPKVKIELIEATPNKSFTDLTRFPLAKMYGSHTFEETAEGLKMTTTMTVTGPLGFLWRKIVAQNIVNGLPEEMIHQAQTASNL